MRSYSNHTDVELLSLLIQSDAVAFTEIYNRYWKKLFVLAANRMHNLEDAEEVVQDIFTSLWNRRDKVEITSELSSYLAVSVKYRVIRTLNRYYNMQKYVDAALTDHAIDDSTQQYLAFDELRTELGKYVQQLPEKCKLVFQLSREEGYSQKQISEELGISEKTVEAHLGKAFKTLRSKLTNFMVTLL
ncbi:RNA polymerase sigma-70 factor [Sphingobacterium pedocola]|uniref:RNA polymerase sigma-70 factor n=1 Tax=Sphingobacterium pedocola TaxID=2082722 RepID=A0ABR9T927_9SPHI|nr:RNA polymerase sigma-70 factor [Sphingobacterium pedocola]MBE8721846.1 RNA polymerase sigma-70 factor [Sphingobacterium pedocola]